MLPLRPPQEHIPIPQLPRPVRPLTPLAGRLLASDQARHTEGIVLFCVVVGAALALVGVMLMVSLHAGAVAR